MPTSKSASDEAIIKVIQAAAEKVVVPHEKCPRWVGLATIAGLFPEEANLRERLQQMVANGILAMSFEWGDFTPTGMENINALVPGSRSKIVGYRRERPIYRIL